MTNTPEEAQRLRFEQIVRADDELMCLLARLREIRLPHSTRPTPRDRGGAGRQPRAADRVRVGRQGRPLGRGAGQAGGIKQGQAELLGIVDRLLANLRTAAAVFMTGDARAARLLAAEKEVFRDLEARATAAHFAGLRAGRIETAETSTLHLDVLRDLAPVNTHLVAAAAYPVLEDRGELLPSRLRRAEGNGGE